MFCFGRHLPGTLDTTFFDVLLAHLHLDRIYDLQQPADLLAPWRFPQRSIQPSRTPKRIGVSQAFPAILATRLFVFTCDVQRLHCCPYSRTKISPWRIPSPT